MPPRKTRSLSSASEMSKRQKKTDATMQEVCTTVTTKQTVAATRLQRVWRSTFAHLLTKHFAVELLKPGVGVTTEYVKSIRSDTFKFCQAPIHIKIPTLTSPPPQLRSPRRLPAREVHHSGRQEVPPARPSSVYTPPRLAASCAGAGARQRARLLGRLHDRLPSDACL
jgi:hypothetical protein